MISLRARLIACEYRLVPYTRRANASLSYINRGA